MDIPPASSEGGVVPPDVGSKALFDDGHLDDRLPCFRMPSRRLALIAGITRPDFVRARSKPDGLSIPIDS